MSALFLNRRALCTSYLDEASERDRVPEEGHHGSGEREQNQDRDVARPLLLVFALAGPFRQPNRHRHRERLHSVAWEMCGCISLPKHTVEAAAPKSKYMPR